MKNELETLKNMTDPSIPLELLQDAVGEIESLRESAAQAQLNLQELQAKLVNQEALQSEILGCQSKTQSLSEELASAKAANEQMAQELAALKASDEVEPLKKANAQMAEALEKLQNELSDLKTKDVQANTAGSSGGQDQPLQDQRDQLAAEVEELKLQLSLARDESQKANLLVDQLRTQLLNDKIRQAMVQQS